MALEVSSAGVNRPYCFLVLTEIQQNADDAELLEGRIGLLLGSL